MRKAEDNKPILKTSDTTIDEEVQNDNFEELIPDNILKYSQSKFKGHKMDRLIEVILKAKGFTTYVEPKGPDNGSDILAGQGLLGYESPWIYVEVKSQDAAVGRVMLDV